MVGVGARERSISSLIREWSTGALVAQFDYFGTPGVSPVSTLGPAIDSRQAVREEDSFQYSQDEYISPRRQLPKLYSLYNVQHDLTTFPICIYYSSIDRIGQRPGPLLQRFRGPSS